MRYIPTAQQRLPLDPLLGAARCATVAELARALTATHRSVTRWARDGVPFHSADRAAIDLGLHPMTIWGDDWLVSA